MEHRDGWIEMTVRRALPIVVIGSIGLLIGLAAAAIGEPVLALAAGLLAIAAAAAGLRLVRQLETSEAARSALQ